jgi:hypothetical protein
LTLSAHPEPESEPERDYRTHPVISASVGLLREPSVRISTRIPRMAVARHLHIWCGVILLSDCRTPLSEARHYPRSLRAACTRRVLGSCLFSRTIRKAEVHTLRIALIWHWNPSLLRCWIAAGHSKRPTSAGMEATLVSQLIDSSGVSASSTKDVVIAAYEPPLTGSQC